MLSSCFETQLARVSGYVKYYPSKIQNCWLWSFNASLFTSNSLPTFSQWVWNSSAHLLSMSFPISSNEQKSVERLLHSDYSWVTLCNAQKSEGTKAKLGLFCFGMEAAIKAVVSTGSSSVEDWKFVSLEAFWTVYGDFYLPSCMLMQEKEWAGLAGVKAAGNEQSKLEPLFWIGKPPRSHFTYFTGIISATVSMRNRGLV